MKRNFVLSLFILTALLSCSDSSDNLDRRKPKFDMPFPENNPGSIIGTWWIKSLVVEGKTYSPKAYFDLRKATLTDDFEQYVKLKFNSTQLDKEWKDRLEEEIGNVAYLLKHPIIIYKDYLFYSSVSGYNPMGVDKIDGNNIVLQRNSGFNELGISARVYPTTYKVNPDGTAVLDKFPFRFAIRYAEGNQILSTPPADLLTLELEPADF